MFVGGDVIRPHLLTTAIGHAWIASETIGHYLRGETQHRRPKVNVHHFDLIEKLKHVGSNRPNTTTSRRRHRPREICDPQLRGPREIADRPPTELFHGHFRHTPQHVRSQKAIDAGNVLGDFKERLQLLTEKQASAEADRCMSCGMCFECDDCLIYCPQKAVDRVQERAKRHSGATSTPTTPNASAATSARMSAPRATSRWASGSKRICLL